MTDELLTQEELAERMHISVDELRALGNSHALPVATLAADGTFTVRRSDLRRWLGAKRPIRETR
jgi:hypothetical protein